MSDRKRRVPGVDLASQSPLAERRFQDRVFASNRSPMNSRRRIQPPRRCPADHGGIGFSIPHPGWFHAWREADLFESGRDGEQRIMNFETDCKPPHSRIVRGIKAVRTHPLASGVFHHHYRDAEATNPLAVAPSISRDTFIGALPVPRLPPQILIPTRR
jgi:hypothetical protein